MKSALALVILVAGVACFREIKDFGPQETEIPVKAIAYSFDSLKLITATENGNLNFFSSQANYSKLGSRSINFPSKEDTLQDMEASPVGQVLAMCSGQNLYLINMTTFNQIARTNLNLVKCRDIEWSSDGTRIFMVGQNSDQAGFLVYNASFLQQDPKFYDTAFADNSTIDDAALSSQGKYLILSGTDKSNISTSSIQIYDTTNGQLFGTVNLPSQYEAVQKSIEVGPNGTYLIVRPVGSSKVLIYERNANNEYTFRRDHDFQRKVIDAKLSPNNTLMVLLEEDSSTFLQVIDVEKFANGETDFVTEELSIPKGSSVGLRISPDGSLFSIAFKETGAKLYTSIQQESNVDVFVPVISAIAAVVVAGSVAAVVSSSVASAASAAATNVQIIGANAVTPLVAQTGGRAANVVAETGKFML